MKDEFDGVVVNDVFYKKNDGKESNTAKYCNLV